jgi:hypothetical protein
MMYLVFRHKFEYFRVQWTVVPVGGSVTEVTWFNNRRRGGGGQHESFHTISFATYEEQFLFNE